MARHRERSNHLRAGPHTVQSRSVTDCFRRPNDARIFGARQCRWRPFRAGRSRQRHRASWLLHCCWLCPADWRHHRAAGQRGSTYRADGVDPTAARVMSAARRPASSLAGHACPSNLGYGRLAPPPTPASAPHPWAVKPWKGFPCTMLRNLVALRREAEIQRAEQKGI